MDRMRGSTPASGFLRGRWISSSCRSRRCHLGLVASAARVAWADVTDRRVPPFRILEALDVVEDVRLGLVARAIRFASGALGLPRGKDVTCRLFLWSLRQRDSVRQLVWWHRKKSRLARLFDIVPTTVLDGETRSLQSINVGMAPRVVVRHGSEGLRGAGVCPRVRGDACPGSGTCEIFPGQGRCDG